MATMLQPTMPNKRLLGEVLVDGDFISHSDLSQALESQRETNERLGETLLRLGVLSEMELKAVLANQADLDSPDAMESAEGVRHRLGDILLKAKRVQPRQLDRALEEQKRTNEKLGEVLLRFGVITAAELDAVLTWQQDAHAKGATAVKLMLGEILVATDVISRDDLKGALEAQRLTKKQIGEILVDGGLVKPNQIAQALKIQSKLFSAALVAILAAGALTGCGVTAPGIDATNNYGNNQHGAIVQFKGTPVQTVQSADQQHKVTIYQNGAHVIDNVPFFQQNSRDNTCAQAASAVLFNYWGIDVSYQQAVNESNRFNLGTTPATAQSYLKSKGLNVQPYRKGTVDFIKSLVDQGRPAMVILDYDGAVHWVVVVGYNDTTNRMIIHDSISGPHTTMSMDSFTNKWKNKTMTGIPVVGGQNYEGVVFDVAK
ncbi:MAG TPA: C39 family peptidase [Pantanalinema sp.]